MMHELALNINETSIDRGTRTVLMPAGSVLWVASDVRKQRKWLEILCDLPNPNATVKGRKRFPSKRNTFGPGFAAEHGMRLWSVICANWSEGLRSRWLDLERTPRGPERDIALAAFWDAEVEKVPGLRAEIGRDPTDTADRLDTFLFSRRELSEFYIVANADLRTDEAEAKEVRIETPLRGRTIIHPRGYLRFATDLDLTAEEIRRVRDPKILVRPRYDRPVAGAMVRDTSEQVR